MDRLPDREDGERGEGPAQPKADALLKKTAAGHFWGSRPRAANAWMQVYRWLAVAILLADFAVPDARVVMQPGWVALALLAISEIVRVGRAQEWANEHCLLNDGHSEVEWDRQARALALVVAAVKAGDHETLAAAWALYRRAGGQLPE